MENISVYQKYHISNNVHKTYATFISTSAEKSMKWDYAPENCNGDTNLKPVREHPFILFIHFFLSV